MHKNCSDITGLRYGMLTAKEYVDSVGKIGSKKARWLFICACGGSIVCYATNVIRGKTRTCGCLARTSPSARKYTKNAALNSVFSSYRTAAKRRNYAFSLSIEQCQELFSSTCFYCGTPPTNTATSKLGMVFQYNGIDRINNDTGYQPDNVVACCRQCNWAKRELSSQQFLAWARRLVAHQNILP